MMTNVKPASQWPPDGLQALEHCPICGSEARELLYRELTDRIFFVAPGQWSLWRCEGCDSAYLDPRPDERTIGAAYRSYYTHGQSAEEPSKPKTAVQRLRNALGNGYRNHRFRTHFVPSSPLGRLVAYLTPTFRHRINQAYRYMPRRGPFERLRVLDIGCGNGEWLRSAREAQCDVFGVEPDQVARDQAAKSGLEVRHSVEAWLKGQAEFDFITISHVIEHVHHPLTLLRQAHALLRRGGTIYVETPNVHALGHQLYARDWFHLDPPRHLMLFNYASLQESLRNAGFTNIRFERPPPVFETASLYSHRLQGGLPPLSESYSPADDLPTAKYQELRARWTRKRSEYLALTALKPN